MKRTLFFFITSLITSPIFSQQKVFTEDIENFWIAYDSIISTNDSAKKVNFIQTLYIDKGTVGLKAFMMARNYNAVGYCKLIKQYPKFWESIRANTLLVKTKISAIEKSITKFKKLYPQLKDAKMYFTIGGLNSGGTVMNNMVLVGAEIATGNPTTVVNEFKNDWLAKVFKHQTIDNIVFLNVHEYVHTQQSGEGNTLLAKSIQEGSCDFIAELIQKKHLTNNYILYGLEHEQELKEIFKKEMYGRSLTNWLYNGSYGTQKMADLGYFMGYQICKEYYRNSKNKKDAVIQIIELKFSNDSAVDNFLKNSRYYAEEINRKELVKEYEMLQPTIVAIEPNFDHDTLVEASLKEIRIQFSKEMLNNSYSINWGEGGKEASPKITRVELLADKKTFKLDIELKPNHKYNFVLTNQSFKSADRYYPLLKNYTIKFKTK